MDIKETKEIIAGMEEGMITLKKIKRIWDVASENGIGAEDLVHIGDLIKAAPDMSVMSAAVEGAEVALEEIKDLDEQEVFEIISLLYAGVKKVEQA